MGSDRSFCGFESPRDKGLEKQCCLFNWIAFEAQKCKVVKCLQVQSISVVAIQPKEISSSVFKQHYWTIGQYRRNKAKPVSFPRLVSPASRPWLHSVGSIGRPTSFIN